MITCYKATKSFYRATLQEKQRIRDLQPSYFFLMTMQTLQGLCILQALTDDKHLDRCRLLHWRRKWQPTAVFLPRESCGQRSLVSCCPWSRTELDTTEATQHACMYWRRKQRSTPVFLPGEFQGQRSLVGCCLCACTGSDTTEVTQQQQQVLNILYI